MTQVSYQELLERYQQVIEISHDLVSTFDLNTLLHQIMEAGTELSDAVEASIIFYGGTKKQLYFQAATNQETEKQLRGLVVPHESIAGWVADTCAALVVDDVHQDPRWCNRVENILDFQTRSLAAIPMAVKGKLIGVIEILNKRSGSFTEDLDVLTVLANQAAIAIQNARLFQQSDMISELVHEIRTPITSITTISYLLQRTDLAESRRIELAHILQQEAQRLNRMATDFLDYSRLEAGRMVFDMQMINLAEVVAECQLVILPNATENQVSLVSHLNTPVPPVMADRSKIKQVVMNLLTNAVKYNRPGGNIQIDLEYDDRIVRLKIQDTGIGIGPEDLPHIFEKYHRGRNSENGRTGTGLGLSISKRIVEIHNGKIEVNSQLDQGSCFTVTLPIYTDHPN
jgi:signal transduction histidine kinase